MSRPVLRSHLAVALAFVLVLLVGQSAARAQEIAPSLAGEPQLPPVPRKPKHPGKLRLRVPFTLVNADGTLGRRTLITITIDEEDRQHALEAADQILDQLFVEPRVDELMDDINKRLGNLPAFEWLPLPPPAPPKADVQGAAAQWTTTAGMIADLVDACEAAFHLLGLHLNLGPLAMRFHQIGYDGQGRLHVGP
jgi:hypothetical protein